MLCRSLAFLSLVIGLSFGMATAVADKPPLQKPSFDSAGVPIHYLVTGREDGEPIVLIHGFADTFNVQWKQAIAALRKDFKVIALDCRGHGGSGKPHDPASYGVEMVHDVARLLDHLKVDKAHIVGYSMGATIALGFAVHHPQRTRTVTLGGGGGLNGSQEKLVREVADSLEKGNGLGPLVIALTPKDQPKPSPESIKLIDKAVLSVNDGKALAAVARGAIGTRGLQVSDTQIQGVRVPMLALVGADDPLRGEVDRLKKLLPKTRVIVIDKADHMTALQRPEFLRGLRQFLDENRQPPMR